MGSMHFCSLSSRFWLCFQTERSLQWVVAAAWTKCVRFNHSLALGCSVRILAEKCHFGICNRKRNNFVCLELVPCTCTLEWCPHKHIQIQMLIVIQWSYVLICPSLLENILSCMCFSSLSLPQPLAQWHGCTVGSQLFPFVFTGLCVRGCPAFIRSHPIGMGKIKTQNSEYGFY
jgi:hypothetical protein